MAEALIWVAVIAGAVLGVVVWGYALWAASGVTYNKGYGYVFGALLGAFLGPIGLALAWMTPANLDEVYRRQVHRERAVLGGPITCGACGLMSAGFSRCPQCGSRDLQPATPAAS